MDQTRKSFGSNSIVKETRSGTLDPLDLCTPLSCVWDETPDPSGQLSAGPVPQPVRSVLVVEMLLSLLKLSDTLYSLSK